MIAAVVVAALAFAALVVQQVRAENRLDSKECRWEQAAKDRSAHAEHALHLANERIENLIIQMQANAQGFQSLPQIGPFPPAEERKYLYDETGLVQVDVTQDDDRDFAEYD